MQPWRIAAAAIMLATVAACDSSAPAPEPPPSGGEDTAATGRPRAAHTATLLPDGRVLLVGGCGSDGCTSAEQQPTVEVYQPGVGFRPGPALRQPRDGHTATVLADGRVLIVGGFVREGQPPLASAEVFDPAIGEFVEVGPLATGRGGHVAVPLPDGRVLVAGGWVGSRRYTDTVEIFDPGTDTFSAGPPMPQARHAPAAVGLPDGRVLVTGGQAEPEQGLASAVAYHPGTGQWRPVGPMTAARFKHAVAPLPDGTVLVLGGTPDDTELLSSTEVFDARTDTFTSGPSMAVGRYKFTDAVTTLADGRLVIAGGGDGPAEAYDPTTGMFSAIDDNRAADTGPRFFATATVLDGNQVLVVGGYNDQIRLQPQPALIKPGN